MSERAEAHDQKLIRMGEYIEAHRQHSRKDERLDQVATLQAENTAQMKALFAAQESTVRKPKARVVKKARPTVTGANIGASEKS
ncbi:MAG: hypothetical protein L0220_35630 [Acidobacteria bacterium]|nr:hypothetical protein [Acidobacteriota bacterium]